jgi:predicted  nucleic acid-binding Zn-ribbon protein
VEKTIQDLTDLSGIDEQLGDRSGAASVSLAALARRRTRLRKKIPGLLLASYDALARTGRRPIVVPVLNAHCSGCRLRLPPQLDSSIRRHRTLCPCPYCHRLLYAPAPGTHGEKSEPHARARAGRGRNAAGIDHIN